MGGCNASRHHDKPPASGAFSGPGEKDFPEYLSRSTRAEPLSALRVSRERASATFISSKMALLLAWA
jgi:hypothetical protein